jgi:lipopolysaccharide/colanic/teichoic acid biosynthesis glycosyltransferase
LGLGRLRADGVRPAWSYSGYAVLKRGMDVVLASLTLILVLPIMLGVWILIRLDSPGPAVFRQTRVGQNGRLFTFFKFRTMWDDARDRFPSLYAYCYTHEQIKDLHLQERDDPRVTRAGRWLRTTSLDELPNLINVLRGEISLVGPRPQVPEMLPYYPMSHREHFNAKPGLVGLAQVSGRGELTFLQMIDADLETWRRSSLWFDLLILVRMLKCVALRTGAV